MRIRGSTFQPRRHAPAPFSPPARSRPCEELAGGPRRADHALGLAWPALGQAEGRRTARTAAGLACLLWIATSPALAQTTPPPDAPPTQNPADGTVAPTRAEEAPDVTPDERPTSAAGKEPSDGDDGMEATEPSSRAGTEADGTEPTPPAGGGGNTRPAAAEAPAEAPRRPPSGEAASPPSEKPPTTELSRTGDASSDLDLAPEAEPTPALPRNRVGGHFLAGVGAAVAVPFGELSPGVGYHDIANAGAGFTLDAGYGVGRDVMIGAYGELQMYSGADDCTGCSATGIGAGAYVRYHLVQGLRFDPWVSYGIGYRSIQVAGAASEPAGDYAGLEWMRLTFGGDWYAFSQFGFGPFIQFGAASMFDRPAGQLDGGVNWRWQVGLRVVVDLPGK